MFLHFGKAETVIGKAETVIGKAETVISKRMLLSSKLLDFWSWCQWLFSPTVG
jgi:hypothetical protein